MPLCGGSVTHRARPVVFNVVDVFAFGPGGDPFTSMTILYDTHPVRVEHGDKYQRLASES